MTRSLILACVPILCATAVSWGVKEKLVPLDELALGIVWGSALGAYALVLWKGVGQDAPAGAPPAAEAMARSLADIFIKQLDDATRRVRDVLGDADALRRSLDRFMVTNGEPTLKRLEAIQAATEEAARVVATLNAETLAVAATATKANEQVARQAMEFHGSMFMSTGRDNALVDQLCRQHEGSLLRMGIEVIGRVGEAIDSELHYVDAAVVDFTAPVGSAERVLTVSRPGFRYRGEVVQQARVVEARGPTEAERAAQALSAAAAAQSAVNTPVAGTMPTAEPPVADATPANASAEAALTRDGERPAQPTDPTDAPPPPAVSPETNNETH